MVLLPEPLVPTKATDAPAGMLTETFLRFSTSPV